jgi:hypothetical protein
MLLLTSKNRHSHYQNTKVKTVIYLKNKNRHLPKQLVELLMSDFRTLNEMKHLERIEIGTFSGMEHLRTM